MSTSRDSSMKRIHFWTPRGFRLSRCKLLVFQRGALAGRRPAGADIGTQTAVFCSAKASPHSSITYYHTYLFGPGEEVHTSSTLNSNPFPSELFPSITRDHSLSPLLALSRVCSTHSSYRYGFLSKHRTGTLLLCVSKGSSQLTRGIPTGDTSMVHCNN